jgi:streptogramin lyase
LKPQRARSTLARVDDRTEEPGTFRLTKEHAVDEIEHVVEEARDRVFVEKDGAAGRAAVELDT